MCNHTHPDFRKGDDIEISPTWYSFNSASSTMSVVLCTLVGYKMQGFMLYAIIHRRGRNHSIPCLTIFERIYSFQNRCRRIIIYLVVSIFGVIFFF